MIRILDNIHYPTQSKGLLGLTEKVRPLMIRRIKEIIEERLSELDTGDEEVTITFKGSVVESFSEWEIDIECANKYLEEKVIDVVKGSQAQADERDVLIDITLKHLIDELKKYWIDVKALRPPVFSDVKNFIAAIFPSDQLPWVMYVDVTDNRRLFVIDCAIVGSAALAKEMAYERPNSSFANYRSHTFGQLAIDLQESTPGESFKVSESGSTVTMSMQELAKRLYGLYEIKVNDKL